jgi:hypothetical protein
VLAINLTKKAVEAGRNAFSTASSAVTSFGDAAGKARGKVSALGKATAIIVGYTVAMEALAAVAPHIEDSAAGVGEMSLALAKLGETDAKNIAGLGKNFEDLGAQLDGLANPNAMQRVDDFAGSLFNLVSFGAVGSSKGGDARRLFLADLETLDQSLTQLVTSGKTDEAAGLFQKLNDKAVAGGAGVDQLAKHLPNYTDAVAAAGAESGGAVAPVADLARGFDKQGNAAALAAVDLETLVKQTSDYTNQALTAHDAARGFEAAIDDASEAVQANGRTLDITTEKGRANQEALDNIASSGVRLAEQIVANGGSEAQYQTQLERTRGALIRAGVQMGFTKEKARQYAAQVLAIPARATTQIGLSGIGAASAAISAFRANINRIPGHKTVFVNVVGGNSPARGPSFASASGGPIRGPGTGTSDSILGFLSNGEHVLTAREVRAAGGHKAIEAFRRSLLTGNGRGSAPAAAPRALPAGGAAGGGGAPIVLEFRTPPGANALDKAVVELLRRHVRVSGGGNVQVALGRAS